MNKKSSRTLRRYVPTSTMHEYTEANLKLPLPYPLKISYNALMNNTNNLNIISCAHCFTNY